MKHDDNDMPAQTRAPVAGKGRAPAENIRFSIGESPLGSILVGRGGNGVCAILIGADHEKLIDDLEARFPEARLTESDTACSADLAKVLDFVAAPAKGLDLQLDPRGTAFQQAVWTALRSISAGLTVSYAELARRIGAPKAVRAVASACAANPIALAVPCHRVVGSDGATTGYRWGVDRKRTLLKMEARA